MSKFRIAVPVVLLTIVVAACTDAAPVDTSLVAAPTTTATGGGAVTTTADPNSPSPTVPGSTTVAPPSTPTSVPTTTEPTPDPIKRARIEVRTPMPGDVTSSPIELTGESMTIDGTVHFRLTAGGTVIAQGIATGGSAGVWAPFAATIEFTNECCIEMLLEVFEVSATDGSELHKVAVPLAYPEES